MKKTLNILSAVDLSIISLWLISLIISRITADKPYADKIAAVFVILYFIAVIVVAVYTVASVILLIKKKKFSLPLLIFTYAINFAWVTVLAIVLEKIIDMGSSLL